MSEEDKEDKEDKVEKVDKVPGTHKPAPGNHLQSRPPKATRASKDSRIPPKPCLAHLNQARMFGISLRRRKIISRRKNLLIVNRYGCGMCKEDAVGGKGQNGIKYRGLNLWCIAAWRFGKMVL